MKEPWNFNIILRVFWESILCYHCSIVLLLESSTVKWKVICIFMINHLHWETIFRKIYQKGCFVANSSLFCLLMVNEVYSRKSESVTLGVTKLWRHTKFKKKLRSKINKNALLKHVCKNALLKHVCTHDSVRPNLWVTA